MISHLCTFCLHSLLGINSVSYLSSDQMWQHGCTQDISVPHPPYRISMVTDCYNVISERPTIFNIFVRSDPFEYLAHSDTPDPGPERPDTVYVPGNPGAAWSQAEIEATRYRILQVGWVQ